MRRRPTYEEVDHDANLNLVEAAERKGVARFGFVSVLGGPKYRSVSPIADARERIADRLRRSPMAAVVVRPTGFFNDMQAFFEMAERGRVWVIGDGTSRINPIHGADLADVVAEGLASEAALIERDLGGPDVLTQEQIGMLAFEALDRAPRIGHVPGWLLSGASRLVGPFNRNAGALMGMFALLAEHDAVGEPVGSHALADFYATLAGRQTGNTTGGLD